MGFLRVLTQTILLAALVAGIVYAGEYWLDEQAEVAYDGATAEWPSYGGDPGGTRYSPLTQITPRNIRRLEQAWVYRTGEDYTGTRFEGSAAFEATPILVHNTLYFSTPSTRVIALDPESGVERWIFDPEVDLSFGRSEFTSRGVSAWTDPNDADTWTIFVPTNDARLIAIDGATGQRRTEFGDNGEVDLTQGVHLKEKGDFTVTSPPAILNDLVIVGSAIGDNREIAVERGVVRAYHARTGEEVWSWDPIPREVTDPGYFDWSPAAAEQTGGANAWSVLSVDVQRGLVYVPTGSAAPDYYGGERPGDNLYANCIVALKGDSGEPIWHFQLTHHDLWDYDVPAQPVLCTITRDGKEIPAVIQANKMGFLFFFDRVTGEPIFPIEERPVPQSTVPGEVASPTQPFPTMPPPLTPQTFGVEHAWGPLGIGKDDAAIKIALLDYKGIYTPPSLDGAILYPGNAGGTNWGSVAVDSERGIAVLNMSHMPFEVRLIPRDELQTAIDNRRPAEEIARQDGTPYAMSRRPLLSDMEIPMYKPPWGTIAGVDINSGEILWQETLGTLRDITANEFIVPLPLQTGTPNLGGPIVTAGGVTFIAATMDYYLRAFETATGREIWKRRLPAGGQATPMTYRINPEGKQFVVICAGGHGKMGTKLGDYVVAFALSD